MVQALTLELFTGYLGECNMVEVKTRRTVLLPTIPTGDGTNDAGTIRRWRAGHADALRELSRSIREDLLNGGFRLAPKTPANAADAGDKGEVCFDADYLYVCVAANTWVRVGIATWP